MLLDMGPEPSKLWNLPFQQSPRQIKGLSNNKKETLNTAPRNTRIKRDGLQSEMAASRQAPASYRVDVSAIKMDATDDRITDITECEMRTLAILLGVASTT